MESRKTGRDVIIERMEVAMNVGCASVVTGVLGGNGWHAFAIAYGFLDNFLIFFCERFVLNFLLFEVFIDRG